MYTNVLELLETSAERYPSRLAFGDVEKDITFLELKEKAKQRYLNQQLRNKH